MQINKNRKGLALGAVFGLVASLFAGATPASATAATNAFTFTPAGGTSFAVVNVEDFHMVVQRNPAIIDATEFADLHYQITTNRTTGTAATGTTYSMAVVTGTNTGLIRPISVSPEIPVDQVESYGTSTGQNHFANQILYYAGVVASTNSTLVGTFAAEPKVATQSYVVDPATFSATANNYIGLQVIGAQTFSPTITADITAFLDLNGNNVFDAGSEPSATQRVTFLNGAAVSRTVTVGGLASGDKSFTASASVTGVNTTQMSGKWSLKFDHTNGISYSSPAEVTLTESPAGVSTFTQSIYSTSAAVGSRTVSAQLVYFRADNENLGAAMPTATTDLRKTVFWPTAGTVTVTAAGASSLGSFYAVTNDNAIVDPDGVADKYDVRANSTVTLRASFSGVVSSSATLATFTFNDVSLSTLKTLSVNGGTAQTVGTHSAVTAVVNPVTGVASITLTPSGFGTGDDLTVGVSVPGVAESEIVLDTVENNWVMTADATDVATAPSTGVDIGVTVKDQFGVKSARTDQRILFSWASGYSGTATTSIVALVAGYAKATMVPSRTPVTGSASVTMTLQNLSGTIWSNDSATVRTTNVEVTTVANGFRAGLAASYSASISYGTQLSWSDAIDAAYVIVTGSSVVVSGPGLMFKDANGDTASDTITLPGNSTAQVTFHVTARLAGTYTVTLTAGSATTTSQIVVLPARSDAGASIVWDTTTIEAGKTRIVVGTVLDANGNPVDTTGHGTIPTGSTASILVSFTGTAGLVIGTLPTETDADGKFQVSVLTSAADRGILNLSASYLKAGASTAVADVVTSVNPITVGAASAAAPAADQKLTVGSFKGFVAIYALNYTGQKLSAKVAGKWLVVNELSKFQRVVRNTGAGYTIKVDLYIDGAFVRSETIVTK